MYTYLYLASQSPRRQELLQQMGVTYKLLIADATEDTESLENHIAGESSLEYVQRVTLAKLTASVNRLQTRHLPWAPILCADTTVSIQVSDSEGTEEILGKPVDNEDAVRILQQLSGKTHQVHTAIAIQNELDGKPELLISSSNVTFEKLSIDQIHAYIATGEHMGKAGAYGIQGLAACFIKHIEGSFSGIMGLPVFETAQIIKNVVEYKLN
ncbi:septum formation protein Maf [Polynucleobacter sp. MWH-Spelu-300-X4]|uniref:Maf family protein n=1 Tax=Polynucleobacter sp. MWH-Spelu-300-X4 TaxID=2689109 RepID=UPI001BFDE4FD|nr:Maf family protein [Polynucleobacter sp. MWH-Spelu-300-X4]QWD80134.1 septum formation protein Maf [Polynucleobacter sp. MWH-Spelu-300-X4]